MRALVLFSLIAFTVAGCKSDKDAVETAEPTAEASPEPTEDPSPDAPPSDAPAAENDPPTEPPSEAAPAPDDPAVATPAATTPQPRDLASELQSAVGSPIDCLQDFRPSSARTIRVQISGIVRSTGMVIEPSASGAGLSRNDQRCIEERVGNVVLAPLGGTKSEPVWTTIDLQYTPPESSGVESFEVNPPPPPEKDVVPSLPKKQPIAPSGKPIEGGNDVPIQGPSGKPIEGGDPVPVEGPKAVPIGSDL